MTNRALITGASRGLGRTLAEFLAARSWHLILTARGADDLHAVADDLSRLSNKSGGEILALPGDVSDAAHRQALVDAARKLGGLDLLVNNASLLGPSPQPLLADYPLETLEQVYAVNVFAPLALVQAALPLLRESSGLVVNVSSDAAVGGYAGWGGYGSSKAALDLISRTLGEELREQGVAVVAVDPGDLRTQMHQEAFPGEEISDRPLPEVTLPFWAWLLGQGAMAISGQRFRAQGESWLVGA